MDQKTKTVMKKLRYAMLMRPVFNMNALFSDETENYVTPMEPKPGDRIRIRLRTQKDNVDCVYFISGALKKEMTLEFCEGRFDYYMIEIEAGTEPIYYYFEIQNGQFRCFYNKCGVSRDLQQSKSFCIAPGFATPKWAKGAVMYQIFTDRFCNGDTGNDVLDKEYVYIGDYTTQVQDWNKLPAAMGVREFYGGDLQGVMDKLDYLQELGIDVVYFNPLFVSPSNHKYDIQDYDYIDPHFGKIVRDAGALVRDGEHDNRQATRYINRVTGLDNLEASNELFISLVEELHKRGMRVILDGVFNHCGSFNKWMDRERIYENQNGYEKGAYVSADSLYRSFFRFQNEHEWPYNPFYDGWWGHDTLPKLNYEDSPKLEEYILRIAKKWVSPPYNVDGWRLDVAADLGFSLEYNHEFWRKFRRAVKEANPDAIILAEHYGDASGWLRGDQWDTVMNYDAFMEPLTWFFTGMEKHSDEFREGMLGNADSFIGAMKYHMACMMAPSQQVAMNELSNHDHSRFLTRTNGRVGRVETLGGSAAKDGIHPEVMREAVVMQMTWPGAPTVYYGDEAGVCGFTDPDNRRTYPWGQEDQQMLAFHKRAIALHKRYPVFTNGSLKFLYGSYNCLAYGRFSRESQIAVIFNNNPYEEEIQVPVWEIGVTKQQVMRRVFVTGPEGFTEEPAIYPVYSGIVTVRLQGTSAVVLVAEKGDWPGDRTGTI
ncbi:MAG: glycoside hydrolase family 13 protein [Lachnospiraceae bacterium]|jgi:alpha-glucosidase|nr:glycoside hydrolase family 13 protein [Lachnospiraceae bacterium]